jgi:hypothetical protein
MHLPPHQIQCTWPEDMKPHHLHFREPHGLPRLSPVTERLRGRSERWVAAARVTPPPELPERGRDDAGVESFLFCARGHGAKEKQTGSHGEAGAPRREEKVGPTGMVGRYARHR